MNWLSMHELSGLWTIIDEFGMMYVGNMVGWLMVYIEMRVVCMIIPYLVGETLIWYGQDVIPRWLCGGASLVRT